METKVMVVGSEKSHLKRRPRIRLAGFWLDEIGFKYNSLVTVEYEDGRIVMKVQGSGMDTYGELVKKVISTKAGLLQVRLEWHNKKKTPHLEVKGFWLEQFGFKIGSVIVLRFEYGVITIRLVDLDKL